MRCVISYLNFLILNLGFNVVADLMGCNCGLKLKVEAYKKVAPGIHLSNVFE